MVVRIVKLSYPADCLALRHNARLLNLPLISIGENE